MLAVLFKKKSKSIGFCSILFFALNKQKPPSFSSMTLTTESSLLLPSSIRSRTIPAYSAASEASQHLHPPFPTGISTPLNRLPSSPLCAVRVVLAPCVYFPARLQSYRRKECAERLRLRVLERRLLLLLLEREVERLHLRFLLLRLGTLLLEGLDLGSRVVELQGERADVLLELAGELLELGESGEARVLRRIRSLGVRRKAGRDGGGARDVCTPLPCAFSRCAVWEEGRRLTSDEFSKRSCV